MLLLETKKQLTLNELLRIAYEYGNNNSDMPTCSEVVEHEFSEWINGSEQLFKKLTLHDVVVNEGAAEVEVCEMESMHRMMSKNLIYKHCPFCGKCISQTER